MHHLDPSSNILNAWKHAEDYERASSLIIYEKSKNSSSYDPSVLVINIRTNLFYCIFLSKIQLIFVLRNLLGLLHTILVFPALQRWRWCSLPVGEVMIRGSRLATNEACVGRVAGEQHRQHRWQIFQSLPLHTHTLIQVLIMRWACWAHNYCRLVPDCFHTCCLGLSRYQSHNLKIRSPFVIVRYIAGSICETPHGKHNTITKNTWGILESSHQFILNDFTSHIFNNNEKIRTVSIDPLFHKFIVYTGICIITWS